MVIVCVVALHVAVHAGDWPSWRGPNRDDLSTETGLLKSWPEGGPKKLWDTREAGLGYSGFAIVGNRLYTMGSDGKEQSSSDFLICLDIETGKKIWQLKVGQYLENGWGGGPRSTPTVSADGAHVVAIGAQGDVVCAKTADGSEVWRTAMKQTNLDDPKNLGGSVPSWGYCESALIDGDRVLFTPGGSLGTVACFNLQTGEKIWQSDEMQELAHYSSIIVVNHFGRKQYIQLTASKLFGLDENGKLQWQADFPGRVAVIPTPIYRDGSVYVTAGYGAGCMLVKVSADNQVQEVYKNNEMKNHHGGALASISMATVIPWVLSVRSLTLANRYGPTKSVMAARVQSPSPMECCTALRKAQANVSSWKRCPADTRNVVASHWLRRQSRGIRRAVSGHTRSSAMAGCTFAIRRLSAATISSSSKLKDPL